MEALNQSLGEDYKDHLQAKWKEQNIAANLDKLEFVQEDKVSRFWSKGLSNHVPAVALLQLSYESACPAAPRPHRAKFSPLRSSISRMAMATTWLSRTTILTNKVG